MVVKRSFSNALNKTMVVTDIIFFVDGLSGINKMLSCHVPKWLDF